MMAAPKERLFGVLLSRLVQGRMRRWQEFFHGFVGLAEINQEHATMLRQLLILVHLSGVIIWVGGMFFAYFCLRPASTQVLEPPKRLPLWVASFELFFRYTAVSVALILVSGFAMIFQSGFGAAPIGWHIMLTLGLLMSLVFGYVYLALYPRMRLQCEASAWSAAAATLGTIRRLVGINLLLSAFTVTAAVFAR